MARKRVKYENDKADVDMTPMLDIVFILLIFFIVTTSFVKEEGILVNRPKANQSNNNDNPVIMIKIDETGNVSFNNQLVDIERLPARIENFLANHETSSAVVLPHFDTDYDKVVRVLDQIKLFEHLTISIAK
ncbi:biopolymer transporter ExbD [Thalassomonas viridans]|uniref:Biopolymer transporter ExbD n=1 Tax=Thalassomonas viridans TaxID=137584 RepID=A0AAE9Z166_9GAMM|nr:biopolymer transporter ExbD [Thalassomonas viridans]WDE03332.1 biopolymer transporter ExbD [Thalassomonas viridans]